MIPGMSLTLDTHVAEIYSNDMSWGKSNGFAGEDCLVSCHGQMIA